MNSSTYGLFQKCVFHMACFKSGGRLVIGEVGIKAVIGAVVDLVGVQPALRSWKRFVRHSCIENCAVPSRKGVYQIGVLDVAIACLGLSIHVTVFTLNAQQTYYDLYGLF